MTGTKMIPHAHPRHPGHRRKRRNRSRTDCAVAERTADCHARSRPARSVAASPVLREFTGSITDTQPPRAPPRRVRSRSDLPSRGAALDASRVLAGHGARRQRRGHADSAGVCPAGSRVARPARRLPLSVVDCRLRASRPARRRRRPAVFAKTSGPRRATMYGCNKLYCEQLGRYYARHYKQLAAARGGCRLPGAAFPGLDLRRHGAVGRDVRLRAGDVPCRG